MMYFLIDWYFWTKSLHIISVITWMAALFYLPRLFVYHVERASVGPSLTDTLEVMERRLQKAIMTPGMIATWIFGLALVLTPGVVDWSMVWPWIKMVCVLAMSAFHMWLAVQRKALLNGQNTMSGRGYRLMNEVPTVLMILIVISVVVKF